MTHVNPDKQAQMRAWHRGPRDVARFFWRYYRWHLISAFAVGFILAFTVVFTVVTLISR